MYQLSDSQTDYILNDIRRRGVEMEDLQSNLLDHICCMIEQNLKEGEDFEAFYKKTIPTFFKRELWEIEQETITLLTFKNYYAMKKTMIVSGAIAVAALLTGSFFKIMHWPGASVLLILGIGLLTFLFLPLMLILKTREAQNTREKVVATLGILVGILLCASTLFKLMHWPGATFLWLSTSAVSILLFVPLYFFSGIRNPETKVNTIVTTIILVGATGLLFSLTSIKKSKLLVYRETKSYYQDEQLLEKLKKKTVQVVSMNEVKAILDRCAKIKERILLAETGLTTLPPDFETRDIVIYEALLGDLGSDFAPGGTGISLFTELQQHILAYNSKISDESSRLPVDYPFFSKNPIDIGGCVNLSTLHSLSQMQLFLLALEPKK